MLRFLIIFSILYLGCQGPTNVTMQPKVQAPFEKLDTLATNDWWNRAKNPILDLDVPRNEVIAFGIYTVSHDVLKLTAQFFPLFPNESRDVRFAIKKDGKWEEIATETINDIGWNATFRIENWNSKENIPYQILHGTEATYEGLIRAQPSTEKEFVLAALSCNSNKDRGNRENYVRNINEIDPDLIFFAGDQSYDHMEHTAAWLKFGMQFRETFRTRPCITIPDDHDIGQGNIWGENGKKASSMAGSDGGYFFHPEYIKMVHRSQTNHLPDPYDPTPIQQDIPVYYTHFQWGAVDFAIVEDRKFKSGPEGKIPQQGPRPDHIRNPKYDPKSIDLEGLTLLGERQLAFLNEWAEKKVAGMQKIVLSQTGFCGGAHIHGTLDNRLHADLDSNGWPQTGRNKALRLIKKANAIHVAGDQHIATVIQHGIDQFDDGPWAFVVPAIVNNYYSRWWWPETEKPGANANNQLPWTGNYLDGFNNKITMHAYANPNTNSNGAGFGIVRINDESVIFECWPRLADMTNPESKQFQGWPIAVKRE